MATLFNTPIVTPLLRLVSKVILKVIGWKVVGKLPQEDKYVVIAVPHTSNWDFPLFLLVAFELRLQTYWIGKDALFNNPFGWFMRYMGGIPVDRSKSNNMVSQMAEAFAERDKMALLLTPEGTRSKVTQWKSGFYHIAQAANVPILKGFVDLEAKEGGVKDLFYPTGDAEADIKLLQDSYKGIIGLDPKRTSVTD